MFTVARTALVIELLTVAGLVLVVRPLAAPTPVALRSVVVCALVAAASAVVLRRAGARPSPREVVIFAAPLAVLAVVVVVLAPAGGDALLLWLALPVLSAGPWAWIVLWRDGRMSRPQRLLAALVAVAVLAVVAFFVGGFVPPVLLLTALTAWVFTRAFPTRARPVHALLALAFAAVAETAASLLALRVVGTATLLTVATTVLFVLCVPWRVEITRVLPVTAALLAAVTVDLLVVLPGPLGSEAGRRVGLPERVVHAAGRRTGCTIIHHATDPDLP